MTTSMNVSQSDRTTQRLLRHLNGRERELRAKIAQERNRVQDEALASRDGSVGDIVDQAFAATHLSMEHDLIDRCVLQLDEIARAQQRIATGEVGICVDCDEPIESARMDANPVAVRCTECQTRREASMRAGDCRSTLGG